MRPASQDSYFWPFFAAIADYDAADHWPKVTVPVLVIQAGQDIYTPRDRSIAAMQGAPAEGRE